MVKKIKLLILGISLSFSSMAQLPLSDSFPKGSLSLRTNIPSLVLLIPSIGMEYKTSDQFALILDGGYSHWNFKRNDKDNYWRHWYLQPQIRKYVNPNKDAYIGLQGIIGEYNISTEQGRYTGGGFAFGKQYYAGKKLLIDIGLTLGYMRISHLDKMMQSDGQFYRTDAPKAHDYFGPTSISITLQRKVN